MDQVDYLDVQLQTFHKSELHVSKLHRIKTLKIHYFVTEFINKFKSSIPYGKYITFIVRKFPVL